MRWVWWVAANTVVRAVHARRRGRPTVVYSPGINALDADVIAAHISFAQHWARVGPHVLRALRTGPHRFRWLHRCAYWALLRALERRIYAGPALLWSLSERDSRNLERRHGRPYGAVTAVPHGVDTARFSPCPEHTTGGRELLVVGNDLFIKGMDTAAAALAYLPEDVTLTVLGDVEPAAVRAAAGEAAPRVHVEAPTPSPEIHYRRAGVVVAPSREDSFGLPPLEAMACGTPVVV
ncbi:MAG: hypothetical protein C4321_01925, partial [Chloroflexota bacterium]